MLLIHCPNCGPRAEIEFAWGGEAHLTRPDPAADDAAWGEYLYFRRNERGPGAERWRHALGCGEWFNVVRDSTTHQITAVYRMSETLAAAAAAPAALRLRRGA